ncbi:V-type proton ATPase subunit G [Psidium guajava]|nr:V-type proton ATPase subunit G [Psidium guajava]
MPKGTGGLSPWMEVAPALLVPRRNRSFRYPGLETIAEDREAEDLDDE